MEIQSVIQLFVSSPSDCCSERQAIGAVTEQLNTVSERLSEIKIDVIDWNDLYPGIDEYPQQVINRQLPDYDIYVGLWRERFGTQTPKAPSGTLEELDRALLRHKQTRRPWIMCYFWQNSQQDFKVIKERLKESGCLYHLFDDTVSFKSLFTNHLVGYLKKGFRQRGESTTEGVIAADTTPYVCMVFRISSPKGAVENSSFHRRAVAIGRSQRRNDIIISDQRVHREQGLFVWQDRTVIYVDFAGGALFINRSGGEPQIIGPDRVKLSIGDAIELPDSSRITLLAIVD